MLLITSASAKINYHAFVYTFDIEIKVSFTSKVCAKYLVSSFFVGLTKINIHVNYALSKYIHDLFIDTSTVLHKEPQRKENKFLTDIYYDIFSPF